MKRYISCNESADSMDMVDFYRITTYEDGRYIEPEFYFYYADDGTDTPGRCVWYHRIIKLEDFIAMDNNAKLDNLAEIVKYVDDLTEEETDTGYENALKEFPTKLSFEDITINTPDGAYHT